MDSSRHVADAIKVPEVRQTSDAAILQKVADPRWTAGRAASAGQVPLGDFRFTEIPKRKVLCSCGAIAEVDLRIATTKMGLGKVVECRCCRNERVAREREELDRHYSGDEEPEDGFYRG